MKQGILSVDRYVAYKAMVQVKEGKIILAFCWAHVRRDFVEVERSWPTEAAWAVVWVERIAVLYHCNDERLEALENGKDIASKQEQLQQQVQAMAEQAEKELSDPQIHPARQKVLVSLLNHWDGLTVFVEHPEVPMDNNQVERTLRGPAMGRKNFWGSGSVWAGELAAMLFSVFATLRLWQLNPRVWLTEYLQACARAGGQAPKERDEFLPWKMTEERRKEWSVLRRELGRERVASSRQEHKTNRQMLARAGRIAGRGASHRRFRTDTSGELNFVVSPLAPALDRFDWDSGMCRGGVFLRTIPLDDGLCSRNC